MTSALDGGEWSASHPGRFTPGNRAMVFFDMRLGGSQSWSGRLGEEKNLTVAGNQAPAVQPVAITTDLSELLTPRMTYPQRCLMLPRGSGGKHKKESGEQV
jgi:hypothetical protein